MTASATGDPRDAIVAGVENDPLAGQPHECDNGMVFVPQVYKRIEAGVEKTVESEAVIPCRVCRPEQFARWAEGQYKGADTSPARSGADPRPLSFDLPERADLA